MNGWVDKYWYHPHPLSWLLWPFSFIFQMISRLRRRFYQAIVQKKTKTPIIVIGNLSVGGVGKTPLVIALANALKAAGKTVGIVSRGYGASCRAFPHLISASDTAEEVGDEPFLIAQKTACPVVIAPKRNQAVAYLEQHCGVDVILSDDGLQHYAMGRDIEIIVIDGTRGLGNGFCLPAGPLREAPSRLKQADFIVVNGGQWPGAFAMNVKPGELINLQTQQPCPLNHFSGTLAAMAGIGHPKRFFKSLEQLGLSFNPYVFPDHYQFKREDLDFNEAAIIMTEKDAVKCKAFASENMYFLPIEAELTEDFWKAFWSHQRLQGL